MGRGIALVLAALAAAAVAAPALAQTESIPRAVERLEAGLAALSDELRALEEAEAGERGPAGPAGPRGERGPAGPPGPKGEPGAAADSGSLRDELARLAGELRALKAAGAGAQGPAGPRGERGPRGLRGAQGPAGPAGERGPRGSQGPRGSNRSAGTGDGFAPEMNFHNNDGERVVFIGQFNNTKTGGAFFADKEGERKVELGVRSSGNGYVLINNGYVNFNNNDDKRVAFIGQFDNTKTGGAFFADKEGERKVELGVRSSGNGYVHVNGSDIHDYAEIFELATREGMRAGAAVAWNPEAAGIEPASRENARLVVGAVAGAGGLSSGVVIGSRADGTQDFPVALSGMVYALVSAEAGPVAPGDLLTPSGVPGVGMRAGAAVAAGAVYGKALGAWAGPGEGLVLMLVMNR